MEAGRAVCKEFGMPFDDAEARIRQSFSDLGRKSALDDPVTRVARNPCGNWLTMKG